MVYCGKPSKACAECRVRRTRCDGKRPSCSQCLRAGRACKGYRDLTDVMFRDESSQVSAKHQRVKEVKKIEPVDSLIKLGLDSPLPVVPASPQNSIQPLPVSPVSLHLGISVEDQATCFFFQNYVLEPESFARGNLQYLADLYGSELVGSALSDSVSSLGLVGLSHFWKAPSIMTSARVKYNSAMMMISTQLRDAENAKADQTLIAIMLMCLYETNTAEGRQSLATWTKHIHGAAALMQMRGKEQLQTPMGYNMFLHLRPQIITNCIQQHTMVPSWISGWLKELDFENEEQAANTVLSELAISYCNLRASMSSFHDYSNPEYIITTACAIEAAYANWARTCPVQYIYQAVTLKERSDEVFSDHYHVYSSIWVATIWNNYRCVRILLNELILDQLCHLYLNNPESPLLQADTNFFENQILQSNTTLLQLCHDICSSVPYFTGFNPEDANNSQRQIPRAIHGNLLLWPLYTAACTNMVSDLMRSWVVGRLQWICDVIGIKQAAPLAFSVEKKLDLLEWSTDGVDQGDKMLELDLSNLISEGAQIWSP